MTFARRTAHLVVAATFCGRAAVAAQADLVAVDVVGVGLGAVDAVAVPYVRAAMDRSGSVLGGELVLSASTHVDASDPSQSLLNVRRLTLARSVGPLDLRLGVGDVSWGLSELRSPVDVLVPRAVLWDVNDGPRLGQPLFGLEAYGGWGNLELVLLPFPRPPHLGGRLDETWSGAPVRQGVDWGDKPLGGLRLARTVGATDIAISYALGGDRTRWITREGPGDAVLTIASLQQLGLEAQQAVGPLVLRTEGSWAERDDEVEVRVVGGVEWYPTPYLSLVVEQGVTSLRRPQSSPLVDDLMVGGQLVTEELRVSTRTFMDLGSGNRHYFATARWTFQERMALELELVGWGGSATEEPALSLRQRNALRVSLVRYL